MRIDLQLQVLKLRPLFIELLFIYVDLQLLYLIRHTVEFAAQYAEFL